MDYSIYAVQKTLHLHMYFYLVFFTYIFKGDKTFRRVLKLLYKIYK